MPLLQRKKKNQQTIKGQPCSSGGCQVFYSRLKCAKCDCLETNQNPIFALLAENLMQPCPQQTVFPQSLRGILISAFFAEISRITSVCVRSRMWELLDEGRSPEPTCRSREILRGPLPINTCFTTLSTGRNSCSVFQVPFINII